MKLLTANLTGKALDWALAVALGGNPTIESFENCHDKQCIVVWDRWILDHCKPDWCLKFIKYLLSNGQPIPEVLFLADQSVGFHPSPSLNPVLSVNLEQAVARCVVQMRLGDEVEVPDELCGVQS